MLVCKAEYLSTDALPFPLLGMNSALMRDYVEYVADYLLGMLGVAPLYGKKNPVSVYLEL